MRSVSGVWERTTSNLSSSWTYSFLKTEGNRGSFSRWERALSCSNWVRENVRVNDHVYIYFSLPLDIPQFRG